MLWKWNMELSVMINLYHVYRFILVLVTLTHLSISQGFGDSGPFSKWQESEKIVVVLFLYFKGKIWVVLVFL